MFKDTVSVHRPGFYAQRFQDFMGKTVFRKAPGIVFMHTFIYIYILMYLFSVCFFVLSPLSLQMNYDCCYYCTIALCIYCKSDSLESKVKEVEL